MKSLICIAAIALCATAGGQEKAKAKPAPLPTKGTAQLQMMQPTNITIMEGGETMVTIHPDGRLEYGKHYTPDRAARAFWDAIVHDAPKPDLSTAEKCAAAGGILGIWQKQSDGSKNEGWLYMVRGCLIPSKDSQ